MPNSSSQTFLPEFDKKLWTAADKLRSNFDAAVHKHAATRSGGLRTASSRSPRQANRSSLLPDTFTRNQHPDLRADFVMALPSAAARSLPRSHPADRPNRRINLPFNINEWWDGKLEADARCKYGTPPPGNVNFPWVQHMLHHLAPNGSRSSNSSGEGDIRRALIEADLVECMVALPGQLFTNTQIPARTWFLTKSKAKRPRPGAAALRDRRRETLFIDSYNLGNSLVSGCFKKNGLTTMRHILN